MMSPCPRRSGLTTSATSYEFHRMSKSPCTLFSESVKKHGWRRFFQQRKNRNLGPKLHFLQPEEVASSEK